MGETKYLKYAMNNGGIDLEEGFLEVEKQMMCSKINLYNYSAYRATVSGFGGNVNTEILAYDNDWVKFRFFWFYDDGYEIFKAYGIEDFIMNRRNYEIFDENGVRLKMLAMDKGPVQMTDKDKVKDAVNKHLQGDDTQRAWEEILEKIESSKKDNSPEPKDKVEGSCVQASPPDALESEGDSEMFEPIDDIVAIDDSCMSEEDKSEERARRIRELIRSRGAEAKQKKAQRQTDIKRKIEAGITPAIRECIRWLYTATYREHIPNNEVNRYLVDIGIYPFRPDILSKLVRKLTGMTPSQLGKFTMGCGGQHGNQIDYDSFAEKIETNYIEIVERILEDAKEKEKNREVWTIGYILWADLKHITNYIDGLVKVVDGAASGKFYNERWNKMEKVISALEEILAEEKERNMQNEGMNGEPDKTETHPYAVC